MRSSTGQRDASTSSSPGTAGSPASSLSDAGRSAPPTVTVDAERPGRGRGRATRRSAARRPAPVAGARWSASARGRPARPPRRSTGRGRSPPAVGTAGSGTQELDAPASAARRRARAAGRALRPARDRRETATGPSMPPVATVRSRPPVLLAAARAATAGTRWASARRRRTGCPWRTASETRRRPAHAVTGRAIVELRRESAQPPNLGDSPTRSPPAASDVEHRRSAGRGCPVLGQRAPGDRQVDVTPAPRRRSSTRRRDRAPRSREAGTGTSTRGPAEGIASARAISHHGRASVQPGAGTRRCSRRRRPRSTDPAGIRHGRRVPAARRRRDRDAPGVGRRPGRGCGRASRRSRARCAAASTAPSAEGAASGCRAPGRRPPRCAGRSRSRRPTGRPAPAGPPRGRRRAPDGPAAGRRRRAAPRTRREDVRRRRRVAHDARIR